MAEVLRTEDLHVRYHTRDGEVKAVNGVDFSLKEGSILCLVGESGSGKTTTALALLGLLPRTAEVVSGKVYYDGIDLLAADQRTLRHIRGNDISMVPQEPKASLNPMLPIGVQIEEQILAHTTMSKIEAYDLAIEILLGVGLADAKEILIRFPFELIGGMCQRVIMAMALALQPKILIADEPTSSLDVTLQAEVLRRLKSFCKELNSSMILITHDMGIVAQMADEVAVMYAGTVVEFAEVRALYNRPRHPYMWALLQSLPDVDGGKRRFQPIPGSPPDLLNLPGQCAFLPRCHKAISKCRMEPKPPLEELEPRHTVACYNAVEYD